MKVAPFKVMKSVETVTSYLLVQSSSGENGHRNYRRQIWQQLQGPDRLFDPQTNAECGAPSGVSLWGKTEKQFKYMQCSLTR